MHACVCVWVFGGVLLGLFLGAGNASGPWSSCFVVWGVGWVSVFCGWHAVGFWGSAPWCLVSPDLGPTTVVYCGGGFGFGGCGWVGCELYSGREHLCFVCFVVVCFFERSVDALASGADEGRGGLR